MQRNFKPPYSIKLKNEIIMKDWLDNRSKNSVYTTLGASSHSKGERQQYDYYATDPKCVDDLLKREKFGNKIWECACGEGHLSRRILQLKFKENPNVEVYSSDIIDRGFGGVMDFLRIDNQEWKGDIITNPPYKYAQEFVEKSLQIIPERKKVAMFLKLTFLEGQKRKSLFKNTPPKTVYVYSKRQECAKNGKFTGLSAVAYCWYVWIKGYKGETKIEWI
jgi:hypothetical protein